jgi:hypothetical protein
MANNKKKNGAAIIANSTAVAPDLLPRSRARSLAAKRRADRFCFLISSVDGAAHSQEVISRAPL